MRRVVLLMVLAAASPAAAGPAAPVAPEEPLAWLEGRIARIRAYAAAGESVRATEVLRELARRLRERGEDPRVAEALVAPPPRPGGTEAEGASELRALEVVRRRLRGFELARERPRIEVPGNARPALEEIFRDPVFRLEPKQPSAAQRIAAWVREKLLGLFEAAVGTLASNVLLIRVAAWAVVAAATAIAVLLIARQVRRGRRFERPADARVDAEDPVREDPAAIVARAFEYARAGRAADALRASQQACVLALRRAGLLPRDPGLTDLEGVVRLDRAPEPVRAGFRRVVEAHDGVVYGGRPWDAAQLREAVEAAGDVVRRGGEPGS